jgi:hypothetical protein
VTTVNEDSRMDRRDFLAATAVAALSPLSERDGGSQSAPRQYVELRRYHLLPGAKQRAFIAFVGDVAIPAMHRAGVDRVGAFTVVYGDNAPSLILVLAPHPRDRRLAARSAGRRRDLPARWRGDPRRAAG